MNRTQTIITALFVGIVLMALMHAGGFILRNAVKSVFFWSVFIPVWFSFAVLICALINTLISLAEIQESDLHE